MAIKMQRIDEVTDEEWLLCNKYNIEIVEEFLMNSPQLSPQTKKTYLSNLKIWFRWVYDNLENIPQHEVKSRDYMKYQNWLINKNHSSSDVVNKRAAISSLNNYIVLYYSDVYPMFHNFIVRGMPVPEKKAVREKNPPTKDEMELLYKTLEERQEWQKIAYLKFTFDTGCRRAESRQLRKAILDSDPIIKEKEVQDKEGNKITVDIKYYQTHQIRAKGKGTLGKLRRLRFSQDTMDAIKKWMNVRGMDDCPYVFITKYDGKINQVGESTLNNWCAKDFSKIIGRPMYPHALRSARATTSVVEDGKSIESVKNLLGHENTETTRIYVVRDEEDDADELFIE